MMDFKLLGSILLIVGTSIGAGMLALPIATANLGFFGSLVLLIVCWSVMTAGAFILLEVNLWLPQNSNLISMARATVGPYGQVIAWITYLLLLYSLLCAYIAGGSDLFHNLMALVGFQIPNWSASICFTLLFGIIVYLGIRSVDYANRGLMFAKFAAYLILIALLIPFITLPNLSAGSIQHIAQATAIMVTVTSFGYSPIVPSLRVYFAGDVKKLKKAILIGSIIPLICYIAWDAAIMGVIPLHGTNSLSAILASKNSTSDMVTTLTTIASENTVTVFARLFTSICVLTSFLGVALCLADFLADGFRLEKKGGSNLFIHIMTFLPPLIIVLFFPNAFIKALAYAGVYCVILLVLMPAWMAWRGRYHKGMHDHAKEKGGHDHFKVPGGRVLLSIMVLIGLLLLGIAIFASI